MKERYKIIFPNQTTKEFTIDYTALAAIKTQSHTSLPSSVSNEFQKLTGKALNNTTIKGLAKEGYQLLYLGRE